MEKLIKSCPFCGCTTKVFYRKALGTYRVSCSREICPASNRNEIEGEERAVCLWNERVELK